MLYADSIILGSSVGAITLWILPSKQHFGHIACACIPCDTLLASHSAYMQAAVAAAEDEALEVEAEAALVVAAVLGGVGVVLEVEEVAVAVVAGEVAVAGVVAGVVCG